MKISKLFFPYIYRYQKIKGKTIEGKVSRKVKNAEIKFYDILMADQPSPPYHPHHEKKSNLKDPVTPH